MKKVWKLILTISFSVAGVGLVFIAAGYILGASSSEVDELFYNAGGYAHLGRIEEMARDMTGRTHHEEHGTEYDPGLDYIESGEEYYGSEEHSYDGIDQLQVEVPAMEVSVVEGARSDVFVNFIDVPRTLRDAIVVSSDGGELKIETDDDKSLMDWLRNDGYCGTLYIEVPEGTRFKDVSLEVGAGTLTVENIYADELDIEAGAGEVYVTQFEAGEAKVQCGAGEAVLTGTVHDKIEIECGVGSVVFNDSGEESDYEYKLDCGIGELVVGGNSYSGLGSTKEIKNGSSTKKMKIECGIGSVEVYFEE